MSLFVTQIFHQLVKSITLLRLTLVLIITIIVLISIKVFSNEENDITNLIFHPIPGHELSPSDPLILQYLRDHHLTAPPHNRTYFDPKTLHPLNYHVLRAMQILFGGKVLPKGKFFLECGANDGQFISNTIKLEIEFLMHKDKFPNWRIGNGKINPSGKYDSPLDAGGFKRDYYNSDGIVNCFPLESLLRAVNVERVDFFSLDVEGHEYKILKAFPFNKFDIKIILVEHFLAPEGSKAIKSLLEENGYILLHDSGTDYVFYKR
ncbi:Protein Star [Folsomia candida]|uniref:Protein Star n=1 Tax=Folsomia candida TaxID=158441 RepID=A0A226E9A2_FOLCA|nr:Protein Star [Folsomia candida]